MKYKGKTLTGEWVKGDLVIDNQNNIAAIGEASNIDINSIGYTAMRNLKIVDIKTVEEVE